MIKVNVTKQSSYPVNSPKLKSRLRDFFTKHGITSDAEVSVAMVGEDKMMEIGNLYLKDDKLHNVFSFTPDEVKNFVNPPDGVIHLGEIVICYPVAFQEAVDEGVKIEERVFELAEHAGLHLLGIHHKE